MSCRFALLLMPAWCQKPCNGGEGRWKLQCVTWLHKCALSWLALSLSLSLLPGACFFELAGLTPPLTPSCGWRAASSRVRHATTATTCHNTFSPRPQYSAVLRRILSEYSQAAARALLLKGPPGSGKTYLATVFAESVGFEPGARHDILQATGGS